MAVTFISQAQTSVLTFAQPAGLTPGDMMIGCVVQREAHATFVPGWTQVADVTSGPTNSISLAFYWRVYAAGDPASWTIGQVIPGVARARTSVFGFSGVHRISPIEAFSTRVGHAGPIILDGITVIASPMVVGFTGGIYNVAWVPSAHTVPAVTQQWYGPALVTGDCAGYGFTDPVVPGPTGNYTFTLPTSTPSDGWASALLSLRSAEEWNVGASGPTQWN